MFFQLKIKKEKMKTLKLVFFVWLFFLINAIGGMALQLSFILTLLLYVSLIFQPSLRNVQLNIVALAISLAIVGLINNIAIPLATLLLLISAISIFLVKVNWSFIAQIAISLLIFFLFFS